MWMSTIPRRKWRIRGRSSRSVALPIRTSSNGGMPTTGGGWMASDRRVRAVRRETGKGSTGVE
jgi:hypothetical protein